MEMTTQQRRVRRDSETSTDSWSFVEEDRLDDDELSMNSTEAEEELENEPIVEEPPTSDDDETASEHSIFEDSESEEDSDSDNDSDSDSDDTASEISDEESDLEVQEEPEDVEGEVEDEDVLMSEEVARMCKEDEEWMEDELEQENTNYPRHCLRILLFVSLFFMIFPIADICTSWVLTYQSHRALPRDAVFFDGFSQQRYNFYEGRFTAGRRVSNERRATRKFSPEKSMFTPLKDILNGRPNLKEEADCIFNTEIWLKTIQSLNSTTRRIQQQTTPPKQIDTSSSSSSNATIILPAWTVRSTPKIAALAPIPPAPFSPRRRQHKAVPRHQPCVVAAAGESRGKKNVPAVIYRREEMTSWLMPRKFHVSKQHKIYTKKELAGRKIKKEGGQKFVKEICGKVSAYK
uniref:Uncharacterized protein n=2 Tax=Caenorhabditis japonica TaxID=281687 RepID=A0A8R1HRX2_CAEJA